MNHSYVWQNGKLLTESYSGTKLEFMYDENGSAFGIIYNGTPYYYVKNLQGDVLRVVDENGSTAASYTYAAWGRLLSSTGTLANINPICYRSYYYDSETGFYYLQSRYYDPEICRFINADTYASTGQGFLGLNMFAYCCNNPVNRIDPTGVFWKEIKAFFKKVGSTISNGLKSVFGAGTSTVYEKKIYQSSSYSPFIISHSHKETLSVSSKEGAKKPVYVYTEVRADDPKFSTLGVRLTIGKFSIDSVYGPSDISTGLSYNNGKVTTSVGFVTDLWKFSQVTEFSQAVEFEEGLYFTDIHRCGVNGQLATIAVFAGAGLAQAVTAIQVIQVAQPMLQTGT